MSLSLAKEAILGTTAPTEPNQAASAASRFAECETRADASRQPTREPLDIHALAEAALAHDAATRHAEAARQQACPCCGSGVVEFTNLYTGDAACECGATCRIDVRTLTAGDWKPPNGARSNVWPSALDVACPECLTAPGTLCEGRSPHGDRLVAFGRVQGRQELIAAARVALFSAVEPDAEAALWEHRDGSPHAATGPLGCMPCARLRREPSPEPSPAAVARAVERPPLAQPKRSRQARALARYLLSRHAEFMASAADGATQAAAMGRAAYARDCESRAFAGARLLGLLEFFAGDE